MRSGAPVELAVDQDKPFTRPEAPLSEPTVQDTRPRPTARTPRPHRHPRPDYHVTVQTHPASFAVRMLPPARRSIDFPISSSSTRPAAAGTPRASSAASQPTDPDSQGRIDASCVLVSPPVADRPAARPVRARSGCERAGVGVGVRQENRQATPSPPPRPQPPVSACDGHEGSPPPRDDGP
jgi:hypothetical protein